MKASVVEPPANQEKLIANSTPRVSVLDELFEVRREYINEDDEEEDEASLDEEVAFHVNPVKSSDYTS